MFGETSQTSALYFFGEGKADGGTETKQLIGGKGASLAEMTKAGLHVPPGFTISSECCHTYLENNQRWPEGLQEQVREYIKRLEELTRHSFGCGDEPLLVAVRSGAAQSMPGMMDTILNVGLNPDCVRAVAQRTGNARAAWEAYRHFLVTFSESVGGIKEQVFANILLGMLEEMDLDSEEQLDAELMEELCTRFRVAYRRHSGKELPTDPHGLLFQAIEAVFRSWNSERAVAYRHKHQIEGLLGTAVNVQAMCPSEVSGVLFTAHPVDPALEQMVIESSFGLGEAVVLGKVTPDRFVVSRESHEVLDRVISDKRSVLHALAEFDGDEVPALDTPSLTDDQIRDLIDLGMKVENYFGHPCDIEWGLSRGTFYMLQARPIKRGNLTEAEELEQLRQSEIARLQEIADPDGTVWSRYNLYEVLPSPTPMTWGIVQKLMSGQGGFGLMYRDLGFDPDPGLDEIGIFDLICGRPYCNLSREPGMYYRRLPFEHSFEHLKEHPHKALYPQARFNAAKAGWSFWLLVPATFVKLLGAALKLRRVSRTFGQTFHQDVLPPYLKEIDKEADVDLQKMDGDALLEHLEKWIQLTLFDFARHSLKATALAEHVQGNMIRTIARLETVFGSSRKSGQDLPVTEAIDLAKTKLRKLVMGVHPEADSDLAGAMRELSAGKMDRETFLKKFGHRGPQEMELANPRWSETAEKLDAFLIKSRSEQATTPESEHEIEQDEPTFGEYRLSNSQRKLLLQELNRLKAYLALRETAKHHLMRGIAVIRKILVELDERYQLDGNIFYLQPDELPALLAGEDFTEVIKKRRRERALLLKLYVPPVLFSDNLEVIGRAIDDAEVQDTFQGVPLSAGVAEGRALVLSDVPDQLPDGDPFVLVCPSTDPAWMPLFVQAQALVMETGGMLSHGAIVAREFHLPAVAGLPNIHHLVKTGQRIHVDGSTGKVNILD